MNVYFNPQITERSTGGQSLGQGLAQLGAGIGQGIAKYKRNKERKEREDSFVEFALSTGVFGNDEQAVRAGVKSLGPEGLSQFAQLQSQMAAREADADIAQQRLDLDREELALRTSEAERNRELSNRELDARLSSIEINRLNASTAQERAKLDAEMFELQKEKYQRAGEVRELPDGSLAIFDGNKFERIPAGADVDPLDRAKEINNLLDPKSPLGEYYSDTRNEKGELRERSAFRNDRDLNPAFERTLADIGLASSNNRPTVDVSVSEVSTPAGATAEPAPVVDAPVINTKAEYDALPEGAVFIQNGQRRVK